MSAGSPCATRLRVVIFGRLRTARARGSVKIREKQHEKHERDTLPPAAPDVPYALNKPSSSVTLRRVLRWQLVLVFSGTMLAEPVCFALDSGTRLLGRHGDVSIADPSVSRNHARLQIDGNGPTIVDLGSRHGTAVNGQQVTTRHLESGDVISFGNSLAVLEHMGAGPSPDEFVPQAAAGMVPAIIQGETGTGKENLALRIHEASGRAGPFVALDCTSLPPQLAESELFDHARGAYSGALTARAGLFRQAHGGTLLIDEIVDLPPELETARVAATDHEVHARSGALDESARAIPARKRGLTGDPRRERALVGG
jgi:predicted ATP-dependent protease